MTLDIKKMTRLGCHFSITMIMIFQVREECLKIHNDDEKTRNRQRKKCLHSKAIMHELQL